jgi:hypothetical protein
MAHIVPPARDPGGIDIVAVVDTAGIADIEYIAGTSSSAAGKP